MLLAMAVIYACLPDDGRATFPGSPGLIAVQRSPEPEAFSSAIWILDWQTGTGRQLTARGYNRSPAFSPDGRWIAFISDLPRSYLNVWAIRPDGSGLHRLTKGRGNLGAESPTFSANGRWVAFSAVSRDGGREIARVAAGGGHRRVLVPAEGNLSTFSPRYSPDGRRLAWVQVREGSDSPAAVYVGRTDGRNRQRVATGLEPDFSPDGQSLVFLRQDRCRGGGLRTALVTFALGSREQQQVASSCESEIGEPAFSPDGDWIVYTINGEERSEIAFLPTPGSSSAIMPPSGFGADFPINAAPSWQAVD